MTVDDRVLQQRPYGSWLLGAGDDDGDHIRIRVRWLLAASLFVANAVGAGVAVVLVAYVMPGPPVFTAQLALVNFVAVPVYMVASWSAINLWGLLRGLRVLRWATDGGELDDAQRRATLRLPVEFTLLQAVAWAGGLLLFTLMYGLADPELIPKLVFSILLSGTVTCTNSYLLCEFSLRPIAARALSDGPLPRKIALGMTVRTLVFWAIGSGAPVAGLMLVALSALFRDDVTRLQMVVTSLALGTLALAGGFLITFLDARSVAAPIRTIRAAMRQVREGDLEAEVVVFDATELGQLQFGFNRMVHGLRERERVKELFGRHVGEDVAEAAIATQIELGGEVRHVAVLFVDVVGSTRIAATRPPTEVVEVLNRFFAIVVDEVHAQGGFVNKFQGDAALAIFGAPTDLPHKECRALRAARDMIARLERDVPEFSAGIGVSAGMAVAGYVGAESRLEYTVIGDPVNEAARLQETAKTVDGHVAVSMRALDAACGDAEFAHWRKYKSVKLRGRTERTEVAILAD